MKDFNALSGADKLDNMTDLLNKAEDLEEVGKILKYSGVSKDFAKGALSKSRWKDQLGDIIEGTGDAAEGVSELKKTLDGLGDGMTTGQKAMEGFKNAGKGLRSVFKKVAPYIAGGAAISGAALLAYYKATEMKRSVEEAKEAQSAYASTMAEVKSLNSEIETTSTRISELESKGTLNLVEQSELSQLKLQNAELERQRDLKKEIADKEAKEAVGSAMDSLNKRETYDLTTKSSQQKLLESDSWIDRMAAGANASQGVENTGYEKTDILTATQNEVKALNELKDTREELLKERDGLGTSKKDKKRKSEIDGEIETLKSDMKMYEDAVSENMKSLQDLRKNFMDETTGAAKEGLSSKELKKFNDITKVIDDYTRENPQAKAAKALSKIWENNDFAQAQQKLVDAFRSGDKLSVDEITKGFPELVAACNEAGVSVETLREEISALASQDTGLTKLEESFSDFQKDVVSQINSVESLNAVLANSYTGKGLGVSLNEETGELEGDIGAIASAYEDLEGYDPATLFEKTANGVHLNREALRQLQAQQEAITKGKFAEKQQSLQEQLNKAYAEQNNYDKGSSEYNNSQLVIDGLSRQLEAVNQLSAAYDGATSAYQKWMSAQSNGEEGDMFRTVSETMRERGKELYKEGRYNTEEFRAISQFYSNQDLATASMKEVVAAYESSLPVIDKYFTGTKQGLDNFVTDMKTLSDNEGLGWVKELENGVLEFQTGADEEIAKRLNISKEAVQTLYRAMTEYDDTIRVGDTSGDSNYAQKIADLSAQAEKAKTNLQQLKEAGSDFPEIDLDVDTSKLDAEGLDARIAELTKARDESETKFGVDSAEVENLNTLLEEAIERKKLLENPSSVSVETGTLDEAIAKATLAADAIKEATGGKVDINVNAKTDSSIYNEIEKTKEYINSLYNSDGSINCDASQLESAQQVLSTLIQKRAELNEPAVLSVDTSNASAELQNAVQLFQNYYDAVTNADIVASTPNVDTSKLDEALSKVETAKSELANISPEIKAELNIEGLSPDEIASQLMSDEIKIPVGLETKEDLHLEDIQDKDVTITVNVAGKDDITALETMLSSLDDRELAVSISVSGKDELDGIKSSINGLSNEAKSVSVMANVTGLELIGALKASLGTLEGKTVDAKANVTGTDLVKALKAAIDSVQSKSVTVSATTSGTGDVSALASAISSVQSKTVYITSVTNNVKGDGAGANGTANANGTTNLYHYSGNANASGDWGVSKNQTSLVNELGNELIVRDGRWHLIEGGAQFVPLKKGDIVFNHKQTAELFANGKVTSGGGRGHALSNGTAFSSGSWTTGNTGNGNLSGGGSYNNTSSSVNNAADNLSKAATDTSEAAEKLSESLSDQIDWIERVFKAMERQFDHLMSQMERITKLPDKQIKMYEALTKNQEYLSNTATAINKYRDHLTSLESQMGLDPMIYNQIKNGSFDISGYDEETKKLIQIYQDYYDKLEDCNSQYDELLEKQDELVQQALDNVEEYWEMMNNQQDTANGYLEKQRELWEELGHSAYGKEQESSIKESIKNQQELAESTQQQIKDYEAEISKLMSQGYMSQGSKEWYEAQAKLNELKEAAIDAQIGLVELEDELRNLKLTRLQHTIDMLDRTAQRLENGTSLTEAKGDKISEADLKKQLDNANALIQANFNKRQELVKEQGLYDVGSKRYQEIADEIAKLDDEIYNASENIEELKNKIWEVRWEPFFEGQEALKDLITETDDFRSMLHSDAFVGQSGGLTIEGITNLALISQGMNAAKQQIKNYNEALKKLDEDLKNGNISTSEYKEQQKDFLDSIRDSVGVVEDYKNEIVDLYRKQLEAENDMVQKSIEKYDKLLDIKKKNDDYSRNLKKQTKDINVLKAQIAALDGVKLFARLLFNSGKVPTTLSCYNGTGNGKRECGASL